MNAVVQRRSQLSRRNYVVKAASQSPGDDEGGLLRAKAGAVMDLVLKVIGGVPGEGRSVTVPPGRELLLGRHGPEQGIALQLLPLDINRRHCEVRRDEDGVAWVTDYQSRNGTWV